MLQSHIVIGEDRYDVELVPALLSPLSLVDEQTSLRADCVVDRMTRFPETLLLRDFERGE